MGVVKDMVLEVGGMKDLGGVAGYRVRKGG